MLGSMVDAEDIVQETFLKAYQMEEQKIDNKKAYLCKMVTNRCLDELKAVRHKREQYVGPWNPAPLLQEETNDSDPSEIILKKEGVSIAFLRMMEHLSPNERAVLLLREVFDFSYSEIATIGDESLNYEKNKSIINRFIQAFQTQNMDSLLELIYENVTLYSDGGGKVRAAVRPIVSLPNVLSLLYGIIKKVPKDFYFEIRNVNSQPAIVIYMNGTLHSILSFYIIKDKIKEMYMTMNPDKLPLSK